MQLAVQCNAQSYDCKPPLYNTLYWVGVAGAFLTSIYTFRLIWVVFFGEEKTHARYSWRDLLGTACDSCDLTSAGIGYFISASYKLVNDCQN